MKYILLKASTIFAIILILFSCGIDTIEDPNPSNGADECMEFVDIHPIAKDARHMFFINDYEGWMISLESHNAILLHTTNAGDTWTVINSDLKFGALSMYGNGSSFKFRFIDSNNGYIALHRFAMDGYGENELYYYTTDKGVTWDAVQPPIDLDDIQDNHGMGVNSTQMVFTMKDTYIGETISYHRLYFVSNTSHTITNYVLLPDDYNFNSKDIHITDAGVINMSASISDQKYMAHSEDYGNSWTFTAVDYLAKSYSYMEFVTDDIGYIPVDAIVWAENQIFYKTTDGGATWIEKTAAISGLSFTHFSFSDADNGLAIRFLDEGLYKTTDGGDTWSRVSCFVNEDYDFDIHTTPQDIAYLGTDNGIVLSSWMDVDANNDIDTYQNRVYFYSGE